MSTSDLKDKVWGKAKEIPGKDPAKVRSDPYGNEIRYGQYGKNTTSGWEIDHITPSARGGSDALRNLQALKTSVNRQKGDSLQKKSRHSKSNK